MQFELHSLFSQKLVYMDVRGQLNIVNFVFLLIGGICRFYIDLTFQLMVQPKSVSLLNVFFLTFLFRASFLLHEYLYKSLQSVCFYIQLATHHLFLPLRLILLYILQAMMSIAYLPHR